MNRITYAPGFSTSRETVTMYGSARGAGAAILTITPTAPSSTSVVQLMTTEDNFVESTARSGVGLYTITLKDSLPSILDIGLNVWGVDGKYAQPSDYNPSTRVLSFKTYSAGGTASDLAATDNLRVVVVGKLNP